MLKVTVEINILPKDQKPESIWGKFFTEFENVRVIKWFGSVEGCDDLEVYFDDSEEVFPLTSLALDSHLRQSLEKIIFD